MANLLKITKQTGGYFLFELTIDGVLQTPFSSMRNDLMTFGNELHFKTSNGANIIKKQNIRPTDLTVIDGITTSTFNTIDEVKARLIALNFFKWIDAEGSGTGSGVSRFDDLADAFSYFGNDGKAVVVDESQLKLKPVSFYNYNKFIQLQDTPDAIIADKILVGNAAGTGLVFESKPSVIPPSLISVGSFHYVDLATVTTPLSVVASIEKKITNDTLSTETNVLNAPYGISSMWNEVANQLDFSQTAVGDLITVIPAIEITTTAANQTFQIYLKTGIGSVTPLTKQIYNGSLAAVGTIVVNAARDFTIDTLDLKDYPSEIYILSNANATVKSGELDIKVVRKNINVVNVTNKTKTSEFINDGDGVSPFATVTQVNSKQDILTAGTNITITGNVISASGGGGTTVTDATTTVKGVLKLAGDLGGTADAPTVPALIDIQAHVASAHAPSNAQKNSDITKAEIEAKLTGEITTHTHPATGGGNGIKVYNVKDYGALGNGVADDTVAIQTTINTAYSAGGGTVYFPIGIYIIGGALLNDVGTGLVDYNSQLYIPQTNLNDSARRTIQFLGEVPPNLFQTLGIGTYTAPNSGVVLRSTIQGSGIRPSVICGRGAAANFNNFSYTTVFFKNLSIQVTPDANFKITMGGINCEFSAIANFENVTVFPYNLNLVNSGEPNIIDVVGISMPQNNCEHINTLRNCSVGGFTHGYTVGEHTSAYDVIAIACVNGFSLQTNHHIATLVKISSFWCRYDFNVDGTYSRFIIQALQVEWATQSKWYDSLATVKDSGNTAIGTVNYNIVAANSGLDNTKYKKIGGNTIKSKQISSIPIKSISSSLYNLSSGDSSYELINVISSTEVVVMIPDDSAYNFDIGATFNLLQKGTGAIRIGATSSTVLTAETLISRKQNSIISLVKLDINLWGLTGDLKLL